MDFSKEILINDLSLNNSINDLLIFLNNIISNTNDIIVKNDSKINFYDVFYYLIYYNSSSNNTHRNTLLKINTENNTNVSESTFIKKIINMDKNAIKNINEKLINFFYKFFKIDIAKLICASDGSNIKLLAGLEKFYKINKNKLYTNATIGCIYDMEHKIPISFDIYSSFNEVSNLINQLESDNIKNNNYKIMCITDRGYNNKKLIKHYIKNDTIFISRITKSNKYIQHIKNNPCEIRKIRSYLV